MANNVYIENYVPAVKLARGLLTKLPVTLSGTSANLAVGGTLAVTGASTFAALSGTGSVTALSGTATTAGGATSAALSMGTAGVGVYFGSGAPTISAAQGSIYLRTDGSSTSTRLYVNTNGTTGWTNFTSAA